MIQALLPLLPGLLLMVFRTGGFVFTLPVFGRSQDSRWARLVLVVGLGTLLYLPAPAAVAVPREPFTFAVLAARETLLGVLLGLGVATAFGAVRLAGEIVGQEMGLNLSQAIDPATGASTPVLGTLFEALALLLFFGLDGHRQLFRLLVRVNAIVPPGAAFRPDAAIAGLTDLVGSLMVNAVLLAAPLFGLMLLLSLGMLVLSRAVPQIHLMEFGFALRIVVALAACMLFLPRLLPGLGELFDEVLAGAAALIVPV